MSSHGALVMSTLVAVNFLAACIGLMFVEVPSANRDVLNMMLGTIGSGWMAIVGYYFGAKKHETIVGDRK